jgi:hypothetical protein
MALSYTRDDLIAAAYRKINVLDEAREPTPSQRVNAAMAANMMLKSWQRVGILVWNIKDLAVFLDPSEPQYLLGSDASSARSATDWVKNELASDAASGAGTVTLDDDDGISDGDIIGVVQDDNTIHWTTVNGAPVANVVTLTNVLTDDAAENNHVYAFTSRSGRPLEILPGGDKGSRIVMDGGNEIPVAVVSVPEYKEIPNKTTTGVVNTVAYQATLTRGTLSIWPCTASVQDYLVLRAKMPITEFSDDSEPDLPEEWHEAFVYNLAARLGPDNGVPPDELAGLKADAQSLLEVAMAMDNDGTSVFIL